MEEVKTSEYVFIFFFLPFILVGIYAFYKYIKYHDIQLEKLNAYKKPLDSRYKQILQSYFLYYNLLPEDQQVKFEKRVHKFLLNKEFIPREIPEVTEEMKVLISASAVQLTLGLTELCFHHFKKIIVYPSRYFSEAYGTNNIGEVNTDGHIILAWDAFMGGYKKPTDAYNVGLHEMAHALKLENFIPNREFGYLNINKLKKLNRYATHKIEQIRQGSETFLRDYASVNVEEFFAVSVEYFFEKPRELKRRMPELYDILSELLNQDPARLMPSL